MSKMFFTSPKNHLLIFNTFNFFVKLLLELFALKVEVENRIIMMS